MDQTEPWRSSMAMRSIRTIGKNTVGKPMDSPSGSRACRTNSSNESRLTPRNVTPAGEMPVAPVIIPMMTINQLTLFNVKAVVTESPLSTSVVGKDFLKRFDSYDMRREELVLRW